jgi:hypothetical protein
VKIDVISDLSCSNPYVGIGWYGTLVLPFMDELNFDLLLKTRLLVGLIFLSSLLSF